MTSITAATQLTRRTARSQWSLFVIDGSNVGHHQQKWRWMAPVALVIFIDCGCHQRRRRWDGATMTQWHWRRWRLLADGGSGNGSQSPAMAVKVLNSPVAVDATTTIPSLALTAAAKKPLPPPPSTAASIYKACYCHR
jgi:hypothetical protein